MGYSRIETWNFRAESDGCIPQITHANLSLTRAASSSEAKFVDLLHNVVSNYGSVADMAIYSGVTVAYGISAGIDDEGAVRGVERGRRPVEDISQVDTVVQEYPIED